MNEKDIKKLEGRISELQKEVELLRRVKELEDEIKRLKESSPYTPYIPYIPYIPQPWQPFTPWKITWTDGTNYDSGSSYTVKANSNDPNRVYTNAN